MSIKKVFFIQAIIAGVLVTSSLVNISHAKNISIYRWVDSDNVVHFSQNLPADQDYTELSTISSFKALSKSERKLLAKEDRATKSADDKIKSKEGSITNNAETYKKNCKAARLNIKMLNTLNDIHINEETSDGSIGSRPLTIEEKAEKLKLSKKHEELYCTN